LTNTYAPELTSQLMVNSIFYYTPNGAWAPGIAFPSGPQLPTVNQTPGPNDPHEGDFFFLTTNPQHLHQLQIDQTYHTLGWVDLQAVANAIPAQNCGTNLPSVANYEGELFNKYNDNAIYQWIGGDPAHNPPFGGWQNIGSNKYGLPLGVDALTFSDLNKSWRAAHLGMLLTADTGSSPLLSTDVGFVVKKDITAGGFVGTNQGEVWVGHGRANSTDVPKIILSHADSSVYGTDASGNPYDTLYVRKAIGTSVSNPANLDVGNLTAHGNLTVETQLQVKSTHSLFAVTAGDNGANADTYLIPQNPTGQDAGLGIGTQNWPFKWVYAKTLYADSIKKVNGSDYTFWNGGTVTNDILIAHGASDTVGNGSRISLRDASSPTKCADIQLSAGGNYDFWVLNSGSWYKRAILDVSGNFTLANGSLYLTGGGQSATQPYSGVYANPNAVSVQISCENSSGVEGGFFAHQNGNFYMGSWSTNPLIFRTDNTGHLKLGTKGVLYFGTGGNDFDVTLYRSAAGVLKTDGSLTVGGTLSLTGTATYISLNNTSGANWCINSYSDGYFYIGKYGVANYLWLDTSGNFTVQCDETVIGTIYCHNDIYLNGNPTYQQHFHQYVRTVNGVTAGCTQILNANGSLSGFDTSFLFVDCLNASTQGGKIYCVSSLNPADNSTQNLGEQSDVWHSVWASYVMPSNNGTGNIGGNGGSGNPYWGTIWSDYFYYKHAPASFDAIDDIEAIRQIKTKTVDGQDIIDPDSIPHLVNPDGFFEVSQMNGWHLSAQKKLLEEIDSLRAELNEVKAQLQGGA
jgi:hypothetical protein